MIIGIIGYGVVGKAIDATVSKIYKTIKYDKFSKIDAFNSLLECQQIFISVPTPFDCNKEHVDLSAILESLERLQKINYSGIVIIKSTIPPGTSDIYSDKFDFDLVFNPFITLKC